MKPNSNRSPARPSEPGELKAIAIDGEMVRGAAAKEESKSKTNVVNAAMGLAPSSQSWLWRKRAARSPLFPLFSVAWRRMT